MGGVSEGAGIRSFFSSKPGGSGGILELWEPGGAEGSRRCFQAEQFAKEGLCWEWDVREAPGKGKCARFTFGFIAAELRARAGRDPSCTEPVLALK